MSPISPSRLPRGVWALGLVSMFMDISSEMIHSLLPVYLVAAMGASTLAVGFIEGVAEATAAVTKIFSGALSDALGKRKLLAAVGYGMAALTKPIFPLAPTMSWLVAARFIDRVGKGVRGAPRDALVADLTPPAMRGAAYGLRQALDTVGAFLGPLLAIALMVAFANDFKAVFWVAVAPAVLSFGLIVFAVRDPDGVAKSAGRAMLRLADVRRLGGAFWLVVAIGAALTLARFSEAFLVLRAHDVGLTLALAPLALVVMNVAYALTAYPAGRWSDVLDRRIILMLGIAVLAIGDLILAASSGILGVAVGIMLWGVHMGLTQGLMAALVADTAPERLRGSAFGLFNLVTGIVLLVASVLAGLLWDALGPAGTFYAGAVFATVALITLLAARQSGVK